MKLAEFLSYFDFDYAIFNGQIRLIDLQDAYLGDIGECRYELTQHGISCLVDRLDIYIHDYIILDLEEQLKDAGVETPSTLELKDLAKLAQEHGIFYCEDVVSAILDPKLIQLEADRIIQSLSFGQIFDELDTKRTIILDSKKEPDVWNFKVFDADMQLLYETSETQDRLADAIINGYMVSKTHERILRLAEDSSIYLNGAKVQAELEKYSYLEERFATQIDAAGDLSLTNAYVTYEIDTKEMIFELHFSGYDSESESGKENLVVVKATEAEKEYLLKEIPYAAARCFAPEKKIGIDLLIQSAAKTAGEAEKSIAPVSKEKMR